MALVILAEGVVQRRRRFRLRGAKRRQVVVGFVWARRRCSGCEKAKIARASGSRHLFQLALPSCSQLGETSLPVVIDKVGRQPTVNSVNQSTKRLGAGRVASLPSCSSNGTLTLPAPQL